MMRAQVGTAEQGGSALFADEDASRVATHAPAPTAASAGMHGA